MFLGQLIIGSNMQSPRANKPGDALFEVHDVLGLTILGLLVAFWTWVIVRRRDEKVRHVFPVGVRQAPSLSGC